MPSSVIGGRYDIHRNTGEKIIDRTAWRGGRHAVYPNATDHRAGHEWRDCNRDRGCYGPEPHSARQAIYRARRRGIAIPPARRSAYHSAFVNVKIRRDMFERLEGAADRRGIRTRALIARLVHTVARDGIVDAVLDDGGDYVDI